MIVWKKQKKKSEKADFTG